VNPRNADPAFFRAGDNIVHGSEGKFRLVLRWIITCADCVLVLAVAWWAITGWFGTLHWFLSLCFSEDTASGTTPLLGTIGLLLGLPRIGYVFFRRKGEEPPHVPGPDHDPW
jgi:hypothetical protein